MDKTHKRKRPSPNSSLRAVKSRTAHRPSCSKTLSNTITAWLDQLPPGQAITEQAVEKRGKIKEHSHTGFEIGHIISGVTPPHTILSYLPGTSRPDTATSIRSIDSDLCKRSDYREEFLEPNGIFYPAREIPLPDYIMELWKGIRGPSLRRQPKGKTLTLHMERLSKLQTLSGDAEVKHYFSTHLFSR